MLWYKNRKHDERERAREKFINFPCNEGDASRAEKLWAEREMSADKKNRSRSRRNLRSGWVRNCEIYEVKATVFAIKKTRIEWNRRKKISSLKSRFAVVTQWRQLRLFEDHFKSKSGDSNLMMQDLIPTLWKKAPMTLDKNLPSKGSLALPKIFRKSFVVKEIAWNMAQKKLLQIFGKIFTNLVKTKESYQVNYLEKKPRWNIQYKTFRKHVEISSKMVQYLTFSLSL